MRTASFLVAIVVAASLAAGCGSDSGATCDTLCGAACVDIENDPANCGDCGIACDSDQYCAEGVCAAAITLCGAGQVACNDVCVSPETDRLRCGASGTCEGANAGVTCDAGEMCSNGECAVGCSGAQIACGDLCIDPDTSREFCGASADCAGGNNGDTCADGTVCVAGACEASCLPGAIDCGGECIDPLSDRSFCGASSDCTGPDAGDLCDAGEVCSAGACLASCDASLAECNNSCVDTAVDPDNCGDCDIVCPDDASGAPGVCDSGTCTIACAQLTCPTALGFVCVDDQTDENHCGDCGVVCSGGASCDAGACVLPG